MTLRVTRRLGGYTQWVRLCAPTGKKLRQGTRRHQQQKNRRRSEPTARSRPESRRLHPVGALARPHQKEAAPSANISTDKEETPQMTLRVTRRLGGYCRGNIPPVGSSRRNNLRKHQAPIA